MANSGLFDFAIREIDTLKKHLVKQRGEQVRSVSDCETIRAYALAWKKSHRIDAENSLAPEQLAKPDALYEKILTATYRATSRNVYLSWLKELRTELISVQGAAFVAPTRSGGFQFPNVSNLVQNPDMASLLRRRMQEVIDTLEKAPLSATIMMGAVLEALFLARINALSDKKKLFTAKAAPKDKRTGNPYDLKDWGLNDFIEVSHELGWITRPLKDIGIVLRDYRNIIHPVKELTLMRDFKVDVLVTSGDAKMFWRVFSEMAEQIDRSA